MTWLGTRPSVRGGGAEAVVTLAPEELEAGLNDEQLAARYAAAAAAQAAGAPGARTEDFSDLVAEQASKAKRKADGNEDARKRTATPSASSSEALKRQKDHSHLAALGRHWGQHRGPNCGHACEGSALSGARDNPPTAAPEHPSSPAGEQMGMRDAGTLFGERSAAWTAGRGAGGRAPRARGFASSYCFPPPPSAVPFRRDGAQHVQLLQSPVGLRLVLLLLQRVPDGGRVVVLPSVRQAFRARLRSRPRLRVLRIVLAAVARRLAAPHARLRCC